MSHATIAAVCACGAKYAMPADAAGRRARCRKCGGAFDVPKSGHVSARNLIEDDSDAELRLAETREDARTRALNSPVELEELHRAAAALSGAPLEKPPEEENVGSGSLLIFVRDSLRSFGFIFELGNALTFAVVALLSLGIAAAPLMSIVGSAGALLVHGWYMAYLLNTLSRAAGGDTQIADITLTDGFWAGVALPLLKSLASWLLALVPFLTTAIYLYAFGLITGREVLTQCISGMLGDGSVPFDSTLGGSPLLGVLFVLAWVLWPMLLIAAALGGMGDMVRIDLMAITIGRAFPAFAIATLLFLACMLCPLAIVLSGAIEPSPVARRPIAILYSVRRPNEMWPFATHSLYHLRH